MKKCKDCKKEISSTATRCQSCAKKGKLNSFYNKHHTKKIKKKMSLLKQGIFLGENNPNYKYGKCCKKYYCKKCGKEISLSSGLYGSGLCNGCSRKGKVRNHEKHKIHYCKKCKNIITYRAWKDRKKLCRSCSQKERFKNPKNHYNYINGKGYEPYSYKFTIKLKEKIRDRDNRKCQYCGKTEKEHLKIYNKKLEIHHIDYNRYNCKENNLITTCKKCNIGANRDRNYWFAYFTYIMENLLCS